MVQGPKYKLLDRRQRRRGGGKDDDIGSLFLNFFSYKATPTNDDGGGNIKIKEKKGEQVTACKVDFKTRVKPLIVTS